MQQEQQPQKALMLSFDKEENPTEMSMYILGPINNETVTSEDLAMLLENISTPSIQKLRVFIDTSGGSLSITTAIISAIQSFKSMGDIKIIDEDGEATTVVEREVWTYGLGMIASAGSWLFLQGDKRCINIFTHAMVHSIASSVEGPVAEMKSYVDHIVKQNDDSLDIIFGRYLNRKETEKYKAGADIWLNSLDLCKKGMVDFIQTDKGLMFVDTDEAKKCKTIAEFLGVKK